ncbi:MAG: SagB-type dehydrogenase domain containing protein-containing protein [Firmicutes bacterium]|nr:SagB-type dehydrogenase domain containing protein-containing protein [Bacillota bacterium]
MGKYDQYRKFLKSNFTEFKTIKTDAKKGTSQPPKVKPYEINSNLVDLPMVNETFRWNTSSYSCSS